MGRKQRNGVKQCEREIKRKEKVYGRGEREKNDIYDAW